MLEDETRLDALFDLYRQEDQIVRLRASNALKRVHDEKPDWFVSRTQRLFSDMMPLDQASTQWTLCQMFDRLKDHLSEDQKFEALVMQRLASQCVNDDKLKAYLKPQLERHALKQLYGKPFWVLIPLFE